MQGLVEDFMGNLLCIGMKREIVLDKGYEYALALQIEQQKAGATNTTPDMMAHAAYLVKAALPNAYRIYDIHNRMH